MSNIQKIHGVNLASNSFFENLCVERLSSDPSPLTTSGRIWYNTTSNQLKISVYDGVSSIVVKKTNIKFFMRLILCLNLYFDLL